ncbi:unnamed protein product, partial [Effrenium voratum]
MTGGLAAVLLAIVLLSRSHLYVMPRRPRDAKSREESPELSQRMDIALRGRREEEVRQCLQEAWARRLRLNVATFSPLIDQAAQRGDLQSAEEWFAKAKLFGAKRDEVELNAVVHAAVVQGNLSAAESWFNRAREYRVQADAVTLTCLVHACGQAGDAERAKHWYRAAPAFGIEPNVVTHACLLHALRKDPVEVEEWLHSGVQENLQPN